MNQVLVFKALLIATLGAPRLLKHAGLLLGIGFIAGLVLLIVWP